MAVKVCHLTSTHRPKDQRIFYKECRSLAQNGYDVFLVEQGASEVADGVHIIGTEEEKVGSFQRLVVRPKKLYRIAKNIDADVYHLHDVELLPIGMKLKRSNKIVVFDSHEDFSHHILHTKLIKGSKLIRKFAQSFYLRYEKRCISKFDGIISVSPAIVDRLKQINSNTVMITNYPLIGDAWEEETAYDVNSDYCVFAGDISRNYSLSFIVENLQGIPNIGIKICGVISDQEEFDTIFKKDKNGIVTYLGRLPYMEVPKLMRGAMFGLLLTTYDWSGPEVKGTLGNNKLFETMLCGIPLICTDLERWKSIVEDNGCGICVSPNDPNQLKDAVRYLMENREEAKKMGSNGQKLVKEKYNWNTQVPILIELYSKITTRLSR